MWQSLFRDLYSSLSSQAETSTERLVLGLHLYTVSRDFQCSGLREEDPETEDILPSGWNRNKQVFSFRYKQTNQVSLYVKAVKLAQNAITVHSLRSDEQGKIVTWKIPGEMISAVDTSQELVEYLMTTVLPAYQQEILDKTFPAPKPASRPGNPLLVEQHPPPQAPWSQPYIPLPGGFYPQVGAPDLYPGMPGFSGGLVGPQHPLFQGAQGRRPPMRIDPLGPFDQIPGARNPDHFPPPGGFGGFGNGGFI